MRRSALSWVILLMFTTACDGPEGESVGGASATADAAVRVVEVLHLPNPRVTGETSLEEALATRRSIREFTPEPLTIAELSQLLWAAQGVTASWGGRTAPSAGALYPLEVYVVTTDALYHYVPEGHAVEVLARGDRRPGLAVAALGQAAVAKAAAVVVVTAVYERTSQEYGERGARYVQLEAGHAAQNVLLEAVSLGLGAVPIGAFTDADVSAVLDLPVDHRPLYLIAIGHPAST